MAKAMPKNSGARTLHIAISGTPGTGKTSIAKRIARRLAIPYISLSDIIATHKLAERYDRSAKTYDVNVRRLETFLRAHLDAGSSYVLDSHLSHLLSRTLVSHVLVTRCELGELNRRLAARRYSKRKIRDNLEAEIFATCQTESEEEGHPTLAIDCTKRISDEELEKIIRRLRRQLPRRPSFSSA